MDDQDFDPYGPAKPWMLAGALVAIAATLLMVWLT
jgi:hypothetical protein